MELAGLEDVRFGFLYTVYELIPDKTQKVFL